MEKNKEPRNERTTLPNLDALQQAGTSQVLNAG